MKAIFLGAGCSYGTLYGHDACPPLAKDFGWCLARRAPDYETRFSELVQVARHLKTTLPKIGLEELWSCIDYYAKFARDRGGFLPPEWDLGKAVYELKRDAVLLLCGEGCGEAAQRIKKPEDCTLGSIISQLSARDTVVSFNWDTIAESLAKKFGKFELRHCLGPAPVPFVRFAKPHGSVSWDLKGGVVNGEPAYELVTHRQEPLLLGAVPIKSELIREVQEYYVAIGIFKVIIAQWSAVVDAVRDADKIIVLGYSFPKEDLYGRFLFQEGIRQRDGRKIAIEYYDANEAVGAAILETFLMKDIEIDLCWKGPVTAAPKT